MTGRRRVLAGLALLLAPMAAAAQGKTPPAEKRGQDRAARKDKPAGRGNRQVAARTGQRATARPSRGAESDGGRQAARGSPGAAGQPVAEAAPQRGWYDEDGPSLRPVDREQVQGWLAANPGWSAPGLPPGRQRRLAQGKPLPPGIAGKALPPELAAALPYFPGYRYVAVGPDLVLLDRATGSVAGLLAGAFAR